MGRTPESRAARWPALLVLTLGSACAATATGPTQGSEAEAGPGETDAPGPVAASEGGADSGADGAPRDAGSPGADAASDAPTEPASDAATDAPTGPRSTLFPPGWRPLHAGGATDPDGRVLPDFAYAGYHQGVEPPPHGAGVATVTVDAALGDGLMDATSGLQAAIAAACAAGGGVVHIPAGLYRLTFPAPTGGALEVRCRGLVLRGDGPKLTRLWLDDPTQARSRAMISVRGAGNLFDTATTTTYPITADALTPTKSLDVAAPGALAVGDYIAVRTDVTDPFREEHRMDPLTSGLAGLWPSAGFQGIVYGRRIESLGGGKLGLDGPTHYPLKTRDGARVYRIGNFIDEVGIESLALGMTENLTSPVTEPGSEEEYNTPGTTAYEVHASRAIELDRVHDAWVHEVESFQPAVNTQRVHLLSSGILVGSTAFRVSVSACDLGFPQYRGGGGNGYLFHVQGSDAIVRDSRAERARHGFIINHAASGTVFLRDTSVDTRYADDSHRFLAHASLYDGMKLDRAWLQAVNRGTTSTGAGFTATQHVFWNTHVEVNHPSARGCAIESAQWGHGYLLGGSAAPGATALLCPTSFSNSTWSRLDQGDPVDFTEAAGAPLEPRSLYEAQRALRCAREGLLCR